MSTIQIQRKHTFTIIEDAVIDDMKLSQKAIMVYLVLARFADKNRKCWPSWKRIAEKARCCRTTVHEAIRELEGAGYLITQTNNGYSNVYILTLPEATRPRGGPPPVRVADPEEHTVEVDTNKILANIGIFASTTSPTAKPSDSIDGFSSSIENKAPPPNSAAPPSPEEGDDNVDIKGMILTFKRLHEKYRGFVPPVNWPGWGKVLKRLSYSFTDEAIEACMEAFFETPGRMKTSIYDFERTFTNVYGYLYDKAHGKR